MSKWKKHARKVRRQLIADMGGQCQHFDEFPTLVGKRRRQCHRVTCLEFHHTGPRTWVARKYSRWGRIKLYRKDWENGILELRCPKHHNLTKMGAATNKIITPRFHDYLTKIDEQRIYEPVERRKL